MLSVPAPALRRRLVAAFALLVLALAAGCATTPCGRRSADRRALRPVPRVSDGHLRADRALYAAFFAASGIPLSPAQAEVIIPDTFPRGRPDRNAMRNLARQYNRVLMVVMGDENFLWEALGNNLPLLVLLPPDHRYSPATTPLIPLAWDRATGTLELLDGNGEIQSVPAADFFARREPLKQAALALVRPMGFRFEPTREQKLLLADFWFDKGFYRRAQAVYSEVEKDAPAGTDVEALLGRGNILVRKGRYADAIPVFRAALALEPDNPKILNNLAYAMLNGDGELMVALRHATKAVRLEPHNPVILETLGSIHLKLGDPVAAAKYLEQAWARALKRSPAVQIAIMDQLVRAWNNADRRDLAWQVAEHRRRTFPEYSFPRDILFLFPDLRKRPPAAKPPAP
jgi:Flp pilus assembly protein TadD